MPYSSPEIPFVRPATSGPEAIIDSIPDQMDDLIYRATRAYGETPIKFGDRISRYWLARNKNPYLPEIDAVARHIGRPGAHMLNMSYEWACTTGCKAGDSEGPTMVRVLDWQLDGLGRNLAIIRMPSEHGDWYNVGWPGFAGVITGMAPGRFSGAINQPPLITSGIGKVAGKLGGLGQLAGDWLASRPGIWTSRALPPAHLLRHVFDNASNWDEAVELMVRTPTAHSALFTLCGTKPDEVCVVEKRPNEARVRYGEPNVSVANHWIAFDREGAERGGDSDERKLCMDEVLKGDFSDLIHMRWIRDPVLNYGTRLIAVVRPGDGMASIVGYEEGMPATKVFKHQLTR